MTQMETGMRTAVEAGDVEDAAARIAGAIAVTPVQRNHRLSQLTGFDVWFKREDLQAARSYKSRGAFNFIDQLDPGARARGVVCASAGNHAQGVAYACAQQEVQARVYLPRSTPRQKRRRVADIGGPWVDTVIEGSCFDEAAAAARTYAQDTGATLVPPFDDPRIVAGQGTVARELVDQFGAPPDALLVPVGGGGLLAGTVAWCGERYPDTRLIGVEPCGAASLTAALRAGRPTLLGQVDTFVDGASVARVGDLPYAMIAPRVDQVITVEEGLVGVEMIDLYQDDGIIAEPAGALASTALRQGLDLPPGARVVCLLSGGNNDLSRYAEVAERALVHEGRKHYFLVDFPQQPGALRRFLDEVLGPDDDITLFEYVKRNNRELGPAVVGIEVGSPQDVGALLARMNTSDHHVTHLPPNTPVSRFLI